MSPYLFSITNHYVQCIFTVTAIGCSIEAANVYYNIINQSVTSLLKDVKDFTCTIRHPDDVIKVLTTTTTTSTTTMTPKYTLRSTKPTVVIQSTSGNSHRVSSAHRNSSHSIILIVLVILLTQCVYR